jgi:hypothetical protein
MRLQTWRMIKMALAGELHLAQCRATMYQRRFYDSIPKAAKAASDFGDIAYLFCKSCRVEQE